MLLNLLYVFNNNSQKTLHISRNRFVCVYRFDKACKGVEAANILKVELKKNKMKIKIVNIILAFLERRREKATATQTVHVRISLSPCSTRAKGFISLIPKSVLIVVNYLYAKDGLCLLCDQD